VQLALGEFHSCGLRNDGVVGCWGLNTDHQLGDGSNVSFRASVVRTLVPAFTVRLSTSGGAGHTCAVTNEDTDNAFCWGFNAYGQIGDGTTTEHATPVRVSLPGVHVLDMAAGLTFSCAVLGDESGGCWGWNADGELGRGFYSTGISPWIPTPGPIVSFP
jgi:alpha-tubulin suppressor-like RCC1 family protein